MSTTIGTSARFEHRASRSADSPIRSAGIRVVVLLSFVVLSGGDLYERGESSARPSAALTNGSATREEATIESLEEAVHLWETGQATRARRQLQSLWNSERALYRPGLGSVVYWYGRVLAATGDSSRALNVWQVGLTALNMADRFDPRVNDAYVRAVFVRDSAMRSTQATGAYLDLFEQADQVSQKDSDARRVIDRHVSQMAFLMEESTSRRLFRRVDQEGVVASAYALRPGKGPALAGWWRGKDPVPRTARNERVEEHLRRVMTAEVKYAFEDRWRGFDERGKIYVRLGRPGQTREVSFAGLKRIEFPEAPIKGIETGLPEHEIWFYPELGEEAFYIFVRRQGRYRLSGPQDLLPQDVRGPYNDAETGKAKLAVMALERILMELRANSDYSRLYWSISDYMNWVNLSGSAGDSGGDQEQESSGGPPSPGSSGEEGGPPGNANIEKARRTRPYVFAQTAQLNAETTRRQVAHGRRQQVPRQDVDAGNALPTVPVQLRRARFLDENGTTRTLLYWTHPTDEFSGNALLDVTAVQRQGDYSRTQQRSRRYVMDSSKEGLQAWVLPMDGGEGTYHLHLQVDQHEAGGVPEGGGVDRGEQTARTVVRLDTLEALEPEPGRLVMSDLLPGLAPSRTVGAKGKAPRMSLSPYPHGGLLPGIDLRLYFEVYGLTFGPEDRTHYTVGYTVKKRREGGVFRLFRDEDTETTTQSTYAGTSRRTQEYIQLQLGEIENAKEVRVTVQVTDEIVDRTVERSLRFEVSQ